MREKFGYYNSLALKMCENLLGKQNGVAEIYCAGIVMLAENNINSNQFASFRQLLGSIQEFEETVDPSHSNPSSPGTFIIRSSNSLPVPLFFKVLTTIAKIKIELVTHFTDHTYLSDNFGSLLERIESLESDLYIPSSGQVPVTRLQILVSSMKAMLFSIVGLGEAALNVKKNLKNSLLLI